MKKTALTFGLFSLVMVATSFTNPAIDTDGTGGQGTSKGGGRKGDFHATLNQANVTGDQLKSFASDSQLTRSQVKLD